MKTEQQLPKNIRQIGSPAGHTKVYIEDYVITFLNSLSMDKNTYVRGAILFGEKKQIGNDLVIFIRGAIEGQNLELDLDETVFDDDISTEGAIVFWSGCHRMGTFKNGIFGSTQ